MYMKKIVHASHLIPKQGVAFSVARQTPSYGWTQKRFNVLSLSDICSVNR